MALVMGVDSSTQSTKVEVRRVDDGQVVATGSAPHPPTEPPVSEQDPASWWEALVRAAGQVEARIRSQVVAVSVAGQQHGLVLVDHDGADLRPAKLWNDSTSAPQADALVEALGPDTWARACGSRPVAAFTVTKLAWVAAHQPELVPRIGRIMLPHDHLTWRLTGAHVTDRGDASGTGWYDPVADSYRPELVTAALAGLGDGFPVTGPEWVERLPRVLGPTEAAGVLTSEAAAAVGLTPGIVVGPGTGDNMAAALGLGLEPGDVVISLGTSGTVYAASPTPTHDPSGVVAGFADATGHYLPLVCTLNATKVTDTMARWLGTDPPGLAELALAAASGAGPGGSGAAGGAGGPVLVPYFDGERTPDLPAATGLMTGLRPTTSRQELALAAHDGVLCGLLDGLDALVAAGTSAGGGVRLVGGGARSTAYRQRAADLLGVAVTVPDADEVVATGAAVQAAAVWGDRTLGSVATAWGLDAGSRVEPVHDASGVRAAYRQAAAQTRELADTPRP